LRDGACPHWALDGTHGWMNATAPSVDRGINRSQSAVTMADELTLQIKTTLAAVQSANQSVSRWLAGHNAPDSLQYFANLVIEELATNCIKYGYDDAAEHLIEVVLRLSQGELELTVSDDGHPFNPLDLPAPDLQAAPEERPIGGLGIHLVRRM